MERETDNCFIATKVVQGGKVYIFFSLPRKIATSQPSQVFTVQGQVHTSRNKLLATKFRCGDEMIELN